MTSTDPPLKFCHLNQQGQVQEYSTQELISMFLKDKQRLRSILAAQIVLNSMKTCIGHKVSITKELA